MSEAKEHWEEIKGLASEYAEARIELVKAEVTEKIARVLGTIFTLFILFMVLAFVLIAFSILAGAFLNHLFGSTYSGYLIVTLVYLLEFILLYMQRKKVTEYFMSHIIKAIYE